MATATWCSDRDSAISPEFFSDAVAIEFPEVSWRDVETLAGDNEEATADLPAVEETQEQQEARTAAEREYLVRQRHYADLDAQLSCVITDDNPFSVSSTMAREVKAFRSVVTSYCTIRNRSGVAISRYSGEGHTTRKAYKPIYSDFLCDVELAAKKALTGNLRKVFQKCIVEEIGEKWASVPVKVRSAIEAKVGHAFSRAGMFPVARYFA
jgi:hypothetical protein